MPRLMSTSAWLGIGLALAAGSGRALPAAAATGPGANAPEPRTLDTPRQFPTITTARQWRARAREIREQVLVSCGLWPLPDKTPLHAHIFGRSEGDGYSVEKVYFEPYPGFYLAGNLYRPLNHGKGPFPAILCPHGHWEQGRLTDTKDCSVPGRCINFARQGMIAFAYDMVGYNDTHFPEAAEGASFSARHHSFATNRTDLLWNISLMGLQTWDSIRALDFLESLPDADPKRLACTGASGGGTQTFMLGAIDSRLAAQSPVVMVSHLMQGGCLCENSPGLRVEFSNMELAAAAAPRPQLLVSDTGDWTRETLTVEGPAIARIYQLLGAPGHLRYVRFDFGHNYNQTSREAVYGWLDHWLLGHPGVEAVKETPFQKPRDADLRVFPDDVLPPGAVSQGKLLEFLRRLHKAQWQGLVPRDKRGLKRLEQVLLPAWRRTLQLDMPERAPQPKWELRRPLAPAPGLPFRRAELALKTQWVADSDAAAAASGGGELHATYWAPPGILTNRTPKLVVLAADHSPVEAADGGSPLSDTASALLRHGLAVLQIERFSPVPTGDPFAHFFSTYNRTLLQQRVGDLVRICAAAPEVDPRRRLAWRVVLAGRGAAGVWSLLAAPAAHAAAADLAGLDLSREQSWLAPDLFCPGVLNIGGVSGAAMLSAPHPLWICSAQAPNDQEAIAATYAARGAQQWLRLSSSGLADDALAEWVAGL
jgi:Acetyl xylan esterase (AXE1)